MHKELANIEEGLINQFINEALVFNQKHNIFIRANKEEVVEKDILDCMPLVEKIKTKEKILDLGSGGGFPGIVLAILRPESQIHLLEKSQKNTLEKYTVITARAFSSTKNILALTKNNLTKNGRYLLLKGRSEKIEEEITAINTNNYKCEIIKVENKKYERHIVQITKK